MGSFLDTSRSLLAKFTLGAAKVSKQDQIQFHSPSRTFCAIDIQALVIFCVWEYGGVGQTNESA